MKKEEGITLIALVITIIVMLILVVVSVVAAINGGLISTSAQAAIDKDMKKLEEQIQSTFVYNSLGKLVYNDTKSNIHDLFDNKLDREHEIKDRDLGDGNFIITINVDGIRGAKYKFKVTQDGLVGSKQIDSSVSSAMDAKIVAFDGNTQIYLMTSDRADDYTEEQTVADINDFFHAYYYAFKSIEYIKENYDYNNPTWLDERTFENEDDKNAIGFILQGIAFSDELDISSLTDNGENMNIIEFCRSKELFERNGGPIEFDSLDSFLTYFEAHKMDYINFYKFACDVDANMDENRSEENIAKMDAYNSMATNVAENNNFSSVENIRTSLMNYNELDSMFGMTGINEIKDNILPSIETERLRKAICISIKYTIDLFKPYCRYTQVLGLIDDTLKGYSENMFSDYDVDIEENANKIHENLLTAGQNIYNEYAGSTFELVGPENQHITINIPASELNSDLALCALIGIICVQDDQMLEVGENDIVTLYLDGTEIGSKTMREWDPAYSIFHAE